MDAPHPSRSGALPLDSSAADVRDACSAGGPEEAALAASVVARAVAADAAVAWAVRTPRGWEQGVGYASATAPVDAPPIFDLASVTKPMTAFAVARSRAITRRAPLGDLLEEARGTASAACPIEAFLAHRAGLDAHLPLYEAVLASDEPRARARAAALRRAADARRADAAGPVPEEGFSPIYSDLGFLLVGEALARAEGAEDAGEVIEAGVARALGREDLGTARALAGRASLEFARRVRPTEVVPFRGGEIRGLVHDENAWALTGSGGSGHAGMFGTAEAVLAFGCAALDAIARAEGPLAPGGADDLAWMVRPRPGGTLRAGFDGKSEAGSSAGERAGPRTFGHLGFTGTSVWIDPDAEAVVVLLTNRVHPTRESVAIRAARPAVHDALFAMAAARRASRG